MKNGFHGKMSPLNYVARTKSNIEAVQFLLQHGAEINAQEFFDRTPQHCAVEKQNNIDTIKLLVEQGSILFDCTTPLCLAFTEMKNIEYVTFLLENGADPDIA